MIETENLYQNKDYFYISKVGYVKYLLRKDFHLIHKLNKCGNLFESERDALESDLFKFYKKRGMDD